MNTTFAWQYQKERPRKKTNKQRIERNRSKAAGKHEKWMGNKLSSVAAPEKQSLGFSRTKLAISRIYILGCLCTLPLSLFFFRMKRTKAPYSVLLPSDLARGQVSVINLFCSFVEESWTRAIIIYEFIFVADFALTFPLSVPFLISLTSACAFDQ